MMMVTLAAAVVMVVMVVVVAVVAAQVGRQTVNRPLLLTKQVYKMPWVYGIAATLPPCVELASSWASRARMPNKGSPLEGKARHTARTDL